MVKNRSVDNHHRIWQRNSVLEQFSHVQRYLLRATISPSFLGASCKFTPQHTEEEPSWYTAVAFVTVVLATSKFLQQYWFHYHRKVNQNVEPASHGCGTSWGHIVISLQSGPQQRSRRHLSKIEFLLRVLLLCMFNQTQPTRVGRELLEGRNIRLWRNWPWFVRPLGTTKCKAWLQTYVLEVKNHVLRY